MRKDGFDVSNIWTSSPVLPVHFLVKIHHNPSTSISFLHNDPPSQYNTVTCSLVLDDYGNLEGFTVESYAHWIPSTSKLSESDLNRHILHDCMTDHMLSQLSPHSILQKGTTTQQKNTIWQYDSIPLVTLAQSLGLEGHDRLNRLTRRLFAVFGRVWSQILPERHRPHVSPT